MRSATRAALTILLLGLAALPSAQWASAQEFRIETTIHADGSSTPIAENLTLFDGPMIYDFQLSGDLPPEMLEVVIYNSREQRFSLVDLRRKMRMDLEVPQLIKMVEGVRQQTKLNPQSAYFLDPLEDALDLNSGWMKVANDQIEYRFTGKQPADVSILPTYFEFLDQYTRLKASHPRSLPPFPRLQLNLAIKKVGWIPTEIEAVYHANELIKSEIRMTARHTFLPKLSDSDRSRIATAKQAMMSAEPVSLGVYRELPRVAAKNNEKAEQRDNQRH